MAGNCKNIDYWRWASEVDVLANNHYLRAEQADNHIDLAMSADLARSLAGGQPWLLLEHSTSAVNWQPRNIAKRPGELRRNSLAHLARGADALMFFQWRAARAGAEKFHSAMLPHNGTAGRGGGRWPRSAATSPPWPRYAAAGWPPTPPCSGTGSPGGRWSWSGAPPWTCPTGTLWPSGTSGCGVLT